MTHTRLVTLRDLPDLLDMIGELAAFHGDLPAASTDQLTRDLFAPNPWFTVILAENAGLVGYAALLPLGQLQFGARGMDIHHLLVRRDARGQGVGTALLAACIDHAKAQGCTFVTVGTHPENTRAAAFYEARAFIRRSGSGPRFSIRLDGAG